MRRFRKKRLEKGIETLVDGSGLAMSQDNPIETDSTITLGKAEPGLSHDDLSGTLFAEKYELIELLGKGGMSSVYKARHKIMDKTFAVKIMSQHLINDEISLKRFKQEAQTAGSLNHKSIVAIHDCGKSADGLPYLVMDCVEGKSLSDILKTEGPLTMDRFLTIFIEVALALQHAHERGVVHRDLKPSNIMIEKAGGKEQVKIVDFGIAKVIGQSSESAHQLTQTGEIFGSPLYMSPEQCTGLKIDQRSDIYSLGCVMYESISGTAPFRGESVFETINKHTSEAPPKLIAEQIEPASLQQLELILLRTLAKDPEDRFQSMSELGTELISKSAKGNNGLLGKLGGAYYMASAKGRASRKSKMPVLVVMLTSVAVLSMLSVLLLQGALRASEHEIKRLERSRKIITEVSLAQGGFMNLSNCGREYAISTMTAPQLIEIKRKKFNEAMKASTRTLDILQKSIKGSKYEKVYERDWRPRLESFPARARRILLRLESSEITHLDMISPLMALNALSSDGIKVLLEMNQEARNAEKDCLDNFKSMEGFIGTLSVLCTGLNGAVLVCLILYFARGTPKKLKELSSQAANLSRNKSLQQGKDEVANLDNVLHELANALSEAEEREKILLDRLKESEKSM